MDSTFEIETELGIEELRARFLIHTRRAYAKLPALDQPRILDIGCGSGLPTMELAHVSGGEIVGIDTDDAVVARLRRRIEEAHLSARVRAVTVSLYATGFADESFDILWGEGVFHLLDPSRSFLECHRLLKPSGYLVIGETITWFDGARKRLPESGFEYVDHLPLPARCWWTEYGAPLEERIRVYRETQGRAARSPALARGVQWILKAGLSSLEEREMRLMRRLVDGLREIPGVTMYCEESLVSHIAVMAFNVDGFEAANTGTILDVDHDIACRTGLHRAPRVHEQLGLDKVDGAVRFGIGPFNTEEQIATAVGAVREIAAARAATAG